MREPEPMVIEAAARGDARAVAEIVGLYQVPLWRFLRRLVMDADAAEDLTQETLIKVFRNLGEFRHQSKLSTWIFQVARNLAIDHLRRRDRRPRMAGIEAPDRADPSVTGTMTEIATALATLDDRQREALLLVEVVGLTYVEAGLVLAIPAGTVKSRVHHARAELRRWLSAEGGSAHAL
jgi:RNA polymerase sigma-70 factor, ECF subfamily